MAGRLQSDFERISQIQKEDIESEFVLSEESSEVSDYLSYVAIRIIFFCRRIRQLKFV